MHVLIPWCNRASEPSTLFNWQEIEVELVRAGDHAIATASETLRMRPVGELTVVNKRMHQKRAHDGAIACGDRRAGASAVSDVPSGQALRYAAPHWQPGGERLRTKDGGNEVQDGLQIDTVRVVAESPQDVQPRLNPAAAGAMIGKGDQPAAREAAPGLDLEVRATYGRRRRRIQR